jgi:hypothetical protein
MGQRYPLAISVLVVVQILDVTIDPPLDLRVVKVLGKPGETIIVREEDKEERGGGGGGGEGGTGSIFEGFLKSWNEVVN